MEIVNRKCISPPTTINKYKYLYMYNVPPQNNYIKQTNKSFISKKIIN